MLESYDNGNSWTNFRLIDSQISNNPYRDAKFSGNGVGSGIQLKNQKDLRLNGRIIFPMYNSKNGIESNYYIYSDNDGITWNKYFPNNFMKNLSESSFVETSNGELYWFIRNSSNNFLIPRFCLLV